MTALDDRPVTTVRCPLNPIELTIVRHLAAGSPRTVIGRAIGGVWGGTTELERRAMHRPPKPRRECGHYLAYQDHKRHGEPIDDACQEAWNIRQREYRAGRRAREAAAKATAGA